MIIEPTKTVGVKGLLSYGVKADTFDAVVTLNSLVCALGSKVDGALLVIVLKVVFGGSVVTSIESFSLLLVSDRLIVVGFEKSVSLLLICGSRVV